MWKLGWEGEEAKQCNVLPVLLRKEEMEVEKRSGRQAYLLRLWALRSMGTGRLSLTSLTTCPLSMVGTQYTLPELNKK